MKIIDKIGSKLDISYFKKAGHADISSILNWNGAILLDENDNKVDLARCYMQELQKLSCGVCVPCTVGTSVAADILEHMCNGNAILEDLDRLRNQCDWILSSSKCTVGNIGPSAVVELIDNFREDFERAIVNKEIIPKGKYIAHVTAPCVNACPSKLDIPNWIEKVRDGRYEDALESVRRSTPLAGILGRTCFHPCQDNCRRANVDETIQICLIRRFAADNAFYSDVKQKFAIKSNGIKVAIIGSGPAGLSCAYYLRLMGYKPVIFEALSVLGGMMTVGIPRYRLPQEFLDKEIGYILSTGVDYELNQRLGTDFKIVDLFKQDFKAVFIAVGAHKGQNINLPGENDNLKGFYDGVEFLRNVALGNKIDTCSKIVIEGGGNVAIDCCRTAIRLGFQDVVVVYRRAKEQMPAASYEVDTAAKEGVKFEFLTNPVSVIQENRAVKGIRCTKMTLGEIDKSGRKSPVEIPDSHFDIECDAFIMAVGQVPDISFLKDTPQIKTANKDRIIVADKFTHMTDMQGVFVGGDVLTGPMSIIDSNRDGKNAARRIDQYIRTGTFEPTDDCLFEYLFEQLGVYDKKEVVDYTDFPEGNFAAKQLEEPVEMCVKNFKEVDKGLTSDNVIYEATRCMRCYLLMLVKFKED